MYLECQKIYKLTFCNCMHKFQTSRRQGEIPFKFMDSTDST